MNINTGQMEALEHFKKNGKDIQNNKLVLILLNKKIRCGCKMFPLLPAQCPGHCLQTQAFGWCLCHANMGACRAWQPQHGLCVWMAQGCCNKEENSFFLKTVSVGLVPGLYL